MTNYDRSESARERAVREFREQFNEDSREYENTLATLREKVPGFAALTAELEATSLKLLRAAAAGQGVSSISDETAMLRKKREDLLESCGYPRDAAERKYRCEKCSDSGFVGLKMCSCLRERITRASLEDSGLGKLIDNQSFENFSLGYYEGRTRELVKQNAVRLREFALSFDRSTKDNFLLIGATGLGKTHLTTSAAKEVIRRGYDVVYRTAQEMFAVFNRQRFGDGFEGDGSERIFFDADLLIVDDLGTEVTTQYTVSWLYDVINSRLNAEKPMIFNTNLSEEELRQRYADRITSRLFGSFTPLYFFGKDVRAQKTGK